MIYYNIEKSIKSLKEDLKNPCLTAKERFMLLNKLTNTNPSLFKINSKIQEETNVFEELESNVKPILKGLEEGYFNYKGFELSDKECGMLLNYLNLKNSRNEKYHQGWKEGFQKAMEEVKGNTEIRIKETEESYKFYLERRKVGQKKKEAFKNEFC